MILKGYKSGIQALYYNILNHTISIILLFICPNLLALYLDVDRLINVLSKFIALI